MFTRFFYALLIPCVHKYPVKSKKTEPISLTAPHNTKYLLFIHSCVCPQVFKPKHPGKIPWIAPSTCLIILIRLVS